MRTEKPTRPITPKWRLTRALLDVLDFGPTPNLLRRLALALSYAQSRGVNITVEL